MYAAAAKACETLQSVSRAEASRLMEAVASAAAVCADVMNADASSPPSGCVFTLEWGELSGLSLLHVRLWLSGGGVRVCGGGGLLLCWSCV